MQSDVRETVTKLSECQRLTLRQQCDAFFGSRLPAFVKRGVLTCNPSATQRASRREQPAGTLDCRRADA